MNNEFEGFNAVPELTLEPFKEEARPVLAEEKKDPVLDESILSEEERREALSYYQSYFEDAGEENEERILKELESPEKVAATIKTDLGMEQDSYDGVYTERGY